ncbi:putative PTS system, lactose-specific IIC component [Anaerococcus lactolyticus ATCC 51172]|uniref:PTS system lactose-specific EIICB component n=1 Tax=Anaerococcus lactolyticus ATCC 51172 TaxID=525254 RepID=C2BGF6_9FIRM|nr:PTS lactose transporter subunit IIBC [Anaerococcus lactolyticus]EEI86083.1 putative PTS system, lactose-specific IIC component [Anaerococcus lactolyticus ATCC 51172]
MDSIIKGIEKITPFFERLSRNKYMVAIKDGFMETMPIVIFSSIFLLVAYIPNIFGFYWSKEMEAILTKPYALSMGLLGLVMSITTAKHFTSGLNREMPIDNQINATSVMFASLVSFMFLSVDQIEGGLSNGFLGSTGLIAAFISTFVVGNIYKVCIKNNLTIKMPKEVPPNISQAFKDIIPFGICLVIFWLFDMLVRNLTGSNLAQAIIILIQPLFSAADSWLGLAIIYGAMAFFWFIGIHGPSIVNPAINAIAFINLANNTALFQAGQHATNIVTPNTGEFIATLGGTGATFVVPFMFMWLSKSKQNKAVGRAAVVPTSFGVNEPILFGGPLVLNPMFMIPFIFAPIVNVWIFKFFVEVLGMNSMIAQMPWTTPGPIGAFISTGFAPLSIVMMAIILVVDTIIYFPFFKAYDAQILKQEQEEEALLREAGVESEAELDAANRAEEERLIEEGKQADKETTVLVLCAGGGTSGLLANALNEGAAESGVKLRAAAGSYGSHHDILPKYDVVVLAPQVGSFYEDIKQDTDRIGNQLIKTAGKEYIALTRDPQGAVKFILEKTKNK